MSNYIDDFRAKMEAQMAELKANDAAAVTDGTLVGRFIQESIADGYAYYVIVDVDLWSVDGGVQYGEMCTVEHVDYCDGYRIPMIESMGGRIPTKYALENVEQRDSWAKLFGENYNAVL